ncbi:MAG: DUF1844 domain-containing protein [Acidobacteria bacterium]|nr:DUF1844 domain-containing protein [Acidobacteriota bacterium]MCG3193619.1 hypothetical protein [Thermoanaerobaculia bacterium]MCK6683956.1 DUF1844 domain-containing protein [Thermoanaerobaculia bacterium]
MSEKDKTLKVVDRRMFTSDGDLREDVKAEMESQLPEPPKPPAPAAKEAAPVIPTNQAFLALLDMLAQTAAMYLQGFPDPVTGKLSVDLAAARQIIESLQSLKEKTAGRLSFEETDALDGLLGQLQLAFARMAAPQKPGPNPGGRPARKF